MPASQPTAGALVCPPAHLRELQSIPNPSHRVPCETGDLLRRRLAYICRFTRHAHMCAPFAVIGVEESDRERIPCVCLKDDS